MAFFSLSWAGNFFLSVNVDQAGPLDKRKEDRSSRKKIGGHFII